MRLYAWLFLCFGPLAAPLAWSAAMVPLTLPAGFSATVVGAELGNLRHVVVTDDGIIYASLRRKQSGNALVALRDLDGDHEADDIRYFGQYEGLGTGLELHDGYLYYSSNAAVYRQQLRPGELLPVGPREVIATGFPTARGHDVRSMAFDGAGRMFVNFGAPSNACQDPQRTPGAPGQAPCPELERTGGIWVFEDATLGQDQMADGERFATGLRHTMAIDWHEPTGALFGVVHGRDQLDTLWPEFYTDQQNADLPGEEFHRFYAGFDGGWPYTYWDGLEGVRRVAPEYGGDGRKRPEAGLYADPLLAFPAHWAPNDMIFYTGTAFPERYRGGVFVAFHGSWNRAPYPQLGYKIAFIPMDPEGNVTGPFEEFMIGFGGTEPVTTPRNAAHRPCGVAMTPDGALIVVDSQRGYVWRVDYTAPAGEEVAHAADR